MATPADVREFRAAQGDLVTLALDALARWWGQVSTWSPDAVVVGLESFLPGLVEAYGDAGALAAADWYDELRDQAAPAGGRFRAVMSPPPSPKQVAAMARWAAGPLFSASPDRRRSLEHLSGGVQRLVAQPARQTIAGSVRRDPARARWARVPGRADPCAFCRMLASRGAVYHSEAEAGGLDMTRYHNECGCVPTPVWPGQQEPYDVDRFLQEYNAARSKAGGNPKAIAAQMRDDLGAN